jgi:hypothetical protein
MMGSISADGGGALPENDGANFFDGVREILSSTDLAIGNLEGPMLDVAPPGKSKCDWLRAKSPGRTIQCYAFQVPTRYAAHLKAAGFDLISLANNHSFDFGPTGRESSKAALDAVGIAHSGEPGSVATVDARGRKVAFIAFTHAPHSNNVNDIPAASALVAQAAASHDLVIVSFHGGGEGASREHVLPGMETYLNEQRGDLRAFTHAVVDAGADLVVGHGPHVVRGVEIYKDRLIAYSLGNFATHYGISVKGKAGITVILEVTLAPDGAFAGGKLHAAVQKRPRGPQQDKSGQAIATMRALSREDFGPTAALIDKDGTIRARSSGN